MSNLSFLRTRFGFVMVGLVLVVCLILLAHQRFFPAVPTELVPIEPTATTAPAAVPVDPMVLAEEWQRSVTAILEDYDRTADARAAKERMLTVRVPANGRDAHLALYLAFNALSESRPDGRAKFAAARAAFAVVAPAAVSSSTATSTVTRTATTPTTTR